LTAGGNITVMAIRNSRGMDGASRVQSFMTGEQKVLLSLEISEFDREIRKQKIRREHPEWCELEVKHELMRQAFRSDPVPEWLERLMQQRLDEHRARQSAGLE
jgi:hypothetical protein